jgi:hypothetical protein
MDFYSKLQGMAGMPEDLPGMDLDPKQLLAGMSDAQLQQLIEKSPELRQKLREFSAGSYKAYSSKEYLKLENLEGKLDSEGGIHIVPDKAFVLKLFAKGGEKIFVNVVTHPAIDPPDERALLEYDGETGIRIPLSMAGLR